MSCLGTRRQSFPYGWVEQSISVVLRGFQSSCKAAEASREQKVRRQQCHWTDMGN